jgi:hypothetical protein
MSRETVKCVGIASRISTSATLLTTFKSETVGGADDFAVRYIEKEYPAILDCLQSDEFALKEFSENIRGLSDAYDQKDKPLLVDYARKLNAILETR